MDLGPPLTGFPLTKARVVIVTDAVLPAVDLSSGFVGVSYDLPFDPMRMDARWANLGATTGEAVMTVLTDESNVDRLERDFALKHELIHQVFGDQEEILGT